MDSTTKAWVPAGTVAEVRAAGKTVVQVGKARVLVLAHGDAFFAMDNRCPHMGFPLDRGDLHDGLLDCHWHHARYDVTCAATLDPWADDGVPYRVEVRDGRVLVDPERPRRDPRAHGLARLARGIADDVPLVVAKAVIETTDGGVPAAEPIAAAAVHGARERADGWQPGLSILSAVANVLPALDEDVRPLGLFQAIRRIAADCANRPPRRPLGRLEGSRRDAAGLRAWFREAVEVRDEDGAERILRTVVEDHGATAALDAVLAAATDHRYAEGGHVVDYAVKCAEVVDGLGPGAPPDAAALLFTSLVPALVTAERMEETSAWRRPVDVAALVAAATVPAAPFASGGARDDAPLPDEDALVGTMLGEDPAATVRTLVARLAAGASPVALADAVVSAAYERVLRFGTSNETPDWDTVHHTLTYANAVAEGMRRAPSPELFRAVLDGATSVYLDRFLNTPPAPPPRDPGGAVASPEDLLAELLRAYDRRSAVQTVATVAWRYLAHPEAKPERLLATLGRAVMREDAGFHEFQQVDLAWRRLGRRGPGASASRALTATARWLASQFPTKRAREQTYRIARRLHLGEALHVA
jgi:nitrite reductase/ring-hydroxylating ferredoxin subunit